MPRPPAGPALTGWLGVRSRKAIESAVEALFAPEVQARSFTAVGSGWWWYAGDLRPLYGQVLAQTLRECGVGFLVVGGVAEMGDVYLCQDGSVLRVPLGPVETHGEPATVLRSDDVAGWLAAGGVTRKVAERAEQLRADLVAAEPPEAAQVILSGLQLRIPKRPSVWNLLGGCIERIRIPTDEPSYVAERRVDWAGVRYLLGQGDGFVGIWDLEHPEAPMRRWPDDRDGLRAALALRWSLVAVPILQTAVLAGIRRWHLTPAHAGGAVLMHFAPEKYLSIIRCSDPPITAVRSFDGKVRVPSFYWGRAGLEPRDQDLLLDTVDDAQYAANLLTYLDPHTVWELVPDAVPRAFLSTMHWIADQVANASPE